VFVVLLDEALSPQLREGINNLLRLLVGVVHPKISPASPKGVLTFVASQLSEIHALSPNLDSQSHDRSLSFDGDTVAHCRPFVNPYLTSVASCPQSRHFRTSGSFRSPPRHQSIAL